MLIEKISDERIEGYRVSDNDNVSTPITSISLEKTRDYLSGNREKYNLSQLPTMDEIPLLGISNHGFPVLCAGFRLENGRVCIFSPILDDQEINQDETTFYSATDGEIDIMNMLLGK